MAIVIVGQAGNDLVAEQMCIYIGVENVFAKMQITLDLQNKNNNYLLADFLNVVTVSLMKFVYA